VHFVHARRSQRVRKRESGWSRSTNAKSERRRRQVLAVKRSLGQDEDSIWQRIVARARYRRERKGKDRARVASGLKSTPHTAPRRSGSGRMKKFKLLRLWLSSLACARSPSQVLLLRVRRTRERRRLGRCVLGPAVLLQTWQAR
jgi:hypothetical protein